MASVEAGARVLDLACGAGSQTLRAAQRVGAQGRVTASDIANTMLHHVQENARSAGLYQCHDFDRRRAHRMTLTWPAKASMAVICRLGLMLFVNPAKALLAARRALRPSGKLAVVVFTTPAANPFMAKPMQDALVAPAIRCRHRGQPGIFALGATRCARAFVVGQWFCRSRAAHTGRAVADAIGRASLGNDAGSVWRVSGRCQRQSRSRASSCLDRSGGDALRFETRMGFVAPAEVLVAAGVKPRRAGDQFT